MVPHWLAVSTAQEHRASRGRTKMESLTLDSSAGASASTTLHGVTASTISEKASQIPIVTVRWITTERVVGDVWFAVV